MILMHFRPWPTEKRRVCPSDLAAGHRSSGEAGAAKNCSSDVTPCALEAPVLSTELDKEILECVKQ